MSCPSCLDGSFIVFQSVVSLWLVGVSPSRETSFELEGDVFPSAKLHPAGDGTSEGRTILAARCRGISGSPTSGLFIAESRPSSFGIGGEGPQLCHRSTRLGWAGQWIGHVGYSVVASVSRSAGRCDALADRPQIVNRRSV